MIKGRYLFLGMLGLSVITEMIRWLVISPPSDVISKRDSAILDTLGNPPVIMPDSALKPRKRNECAFVYNYDETARNDRRSPFDDTIDRASLRVDEESRRLRRVLQMFMRFGASR